ncbi:hypothetical protein FOA52_015452 [Chlamydomonas sp. UWO 241]|nr:hypothetical protein FOA52_015452 [Chlamydomonas sp. UWO 241]
MFSKGSGSSKVVPANDVSRVSVSAPAGNASKSSGLDGMSAVPPQSLRSLSSNGRVSVPSSEQQGKAVIPATGPAWGSSTDGIKTSSRLAPLPPIMPNKTPAAGTTKPEAGATPADTKLWTQVFGERAVRYLLSSDWKEREAAIGGVARSLSGGELPAGASARELYAAACGVLAHCLKDKVAPVFQASLGTVDALLAAFACDGAPHAKALPASELPGPMTPVVTAVLHRVGNANARVHDVCVAALVAVSRASRLGPAFVGPLAHAEPVVRPGRESSSTSQLYGRLELLCALVAAHGEGERAPGLARAPLLARARDGLDCPEDKVRSSAVRLLVEVRAAALLRGGSDADILPALGVLKPALTALLAQRFEEAVGGGLALSGSALASSPASPSRLGMPPRMPGTPGTPTRSRMAPVASLLPSTKPWHVQRPGTPQPPPGADGPSTPLSPHHKTAAVGGPQKSRLAAAPSGSFNRSVQQSPMSGLSVRGALDDTEEGLINSLIEMAEAEERGAGRVN